MAALPVEKVPWARWTAGEELEMLLVLRALGLERIQWTETFRRDPWLAAQWGRTAAGLVFTRAKAMASPDRCFWRGCLKRYGRPPR